MDAVITYVNGMEPSGENNVLSIAVSQILGNVFMIMVHFVSFFEESVNILVI